MTEGRWATPPHAPAAPTRVADESAPGAHTRTGKDTKMRKTEKHSGRPSPLAAALSLAAALAMLACGSGPSVDEFNKAFDEGDLPKAEELVGHMDDEAQKECALQLVEAYLGIDEPDKAARVYDRAGGRRLGRTGLGNGNGYHDRACKMLREYLVAHGDYEKAWNYYPLYWSKEDHPFNAKSRYVWLSDVVDALCKAGKAESARRFVDDNLRWYVLYVDMEDRDREKADYGSEIVRQRLYAQIDDTR